MQRSYISDEKKQKIAEKARSIGGEEKLMQSIEWERERLQEKARRDEEARLASEASLTQEQNLRKESGQ